MSNKIYGGYKSFSELCSEIYLTVASRDDSLQDVQMWGAPPECSDDVLRSAEIELEHIFILADMDYEDFKDELINRTSEKYAYEFCILI